jgi:hypothetical protein
VYASEGRRTSRRTQSPETGIHKGVIQNRCQQKSTSLGLGWRVFRSCGQPGGIDYHEGMEFIDFKDGPEPETVQVPRPVHPYRVGITTGATTRYVEVMALSLQDAIDAVQVEVNAMNARAGWF